MCQRPQLSTLILPADGSHLFPHTDFVPSMLFHQKAIPMRNKLTAIKDDLQVATLYAPLSVTSPVFANKGFLPPQYTCDGVNINPSLDIAHIPKGAKSLAIIMDDIDAPGGKFIHWVAWNIPAITHIKEARPMEAEGTNDFRMRGYRGPCTSFGTHHYAFHVYALDTLLTLHREAKEPDLSTAMDGHILAYGKTTGLYKRK